MYLDNQTPVELPGADLAIDLVGTDANGSLSITVAKAKKAVNPTPTASRPLAASAPRGLKSLSASKINLYGAFVRGIQVIGSLGSITLGNVLNGADITAGAGTSRPRSLSASWGTNRM